MSSKWEHLNKAIVDVLYDHPSLLLWARISEAQVTGVDLCRWLRTWGDPVLAEGMPSSPEGFVAEYLGAGKAARQEGMKALLDVVVEQLEIGNLSIEEEENCGS